MATSDTLAGFQASVDARDSASVLRVIAALRAARSSLLSENKMLFLKCAGGTCPNDIAELLAEWGYEAIAKIPASNTLCFAQARDVARPADGSVGRGAGSHYVGNGVKWLQERAKSAYAESEVYRHARNILLEFRGLRPASLRGRKLHKLLVSPDKFLEDSSYTRIARPALWAYHVLAPTSNREVSIYDFPKRTLLVCIDAESMIDLATLSSVSDGLTLQTELVIVASSTHAKATRGVLSALHCPRVRVYFMPDGNYQAMLRYGLARSYSTNVALIRGTGRCSSDDIDRAFSLLTRENNNFFDDVRGIVGARREVWRDYLAGEGGFPSLTAGVASLMNSSSDSEAPLSSPDRDSSASYSCYAGVDPALPFAGQSIEAAEVVCFDRMPLWPRPSTLNWQQQESLISVVMTVYNAAATVGAALDSVLAQSYSNIEILVVDDCSTDNSVEVVTTYAARDSRIRLLQTARNSGTYFAKNVGLSFACGAFLTFHDSDDVSAINRLEMQALALSADPDAIGNYTRYQRLSENGNEVWLGGRTNRPGYITLMIRREAAMCAAGYFDSVRVSADAEYVERLTLSSGRSVRLLPVVSYYALQAEGSLTTAGVAAFGVDEQGRSTMPPVRQLYRDSAREWHQKIYDGKSSSVMPFPLAKRPFVAPAEILPHRAESDPKHADLNR